jgi:tRNA-specific 2-thiouridylase
VAGNPPSEGGVQVKIRYNSPAIPASLQVGQTNASVVFDKPQESVTPGQACVIYQEDRVLGGGAIVRSIP